MIEDRTVKEIKLILDKLEVYHDALRSYKVLQSKVNDSCKDFTISSREASILGLNRAGVIAGLLGAYKEYINKEEDDTTN